MTTGGAIIMFFSVGFVTVLFAFCLYRVGRTAGSDHLHGYEGEVPDPRRDQ